MPAERKMINVALCAWTGTGIRNHNSQPLFLGGRIIALLGYKMVEGALEKGRIYETLRVNYASSLTVSQR